MTEIKMTKTIQERKCLIYKPENGYSEKITVNVHVDSKITEETNSYIINRDIEEDPSPKRGQS